MSIWRNLGVNYKGSQSNWDADISYFKSLGIRYVRIHLNSLPIPWVVGTPTTTGPYSDANLNAYWRLCAKTFADAGFLVVWGSAAPENTSPANLTSTRWAQYHDAVVAEAAYCQSQGIILHEFNIANEIEDYVDGVTLTQSQCRSNLRQLAVDVKAVYIYGGVTYGCDNNLGTNYNGWKTEGLGSGLTTLSIHPYGRNRASQNYNYPTLADFAFVANDIISTLGSDKCYISEFNIDFDAIRLLSVNTEQSITMMRQIYGMVKNISPQKAFIYSYVGYLNQDDNFAMKNMDGSFNPMWEVLLSDNHRLTTIES